MWFASWFGKRQRSALTSRSRVTHRPRLEALEGRWLPSQIDLNVTSLADSGPGTLRAAILSADAGSHSDKFTINFSGTGTINLQSPLPDLNHSIAIEGPGASSLTIQPATGVLFASAIVTVDPGQTAALSGLTVANGNEGGIVNNDGTLTLANCTVANNVSSNILDGWTGGAGIFNYQGTLTVSGCTVSGNSSRYGGGINNAVGTLTINDSIVSGNSALAGGGILNDASMTLSDSIVSGNSAGGAGGGISTLPR
jgi:hypothetical protein